MLNESIDSLRTIAGEHRTAAPSSIATIPVPELKQMMRDSSAYYLLGYTSTLAPRDGKFHEIQVRVKRKDVEVRARKGYWAYTEEEVAKAMAPSKPPPARDVQDALDGLATAVAPSERHPVRVWLGATRGERARRRSRSRGKRRRTRSAIRANAIDHVALLATSATGEKLFEGPVTRDPGVAPRAAGT